ncbi:MAG: CBS domain-containing protein [Actinomycetota bacterium]|nr:CBS domain-containing protein [Actinomycetota bacterium]
MKVESILKIKGRNVETVRPDTSAVVAIHKLTTLGIGAVVVSGDGERVDGMVSERDIVHGLNKHVARLLDLTVSDVMSRKVPVCAPEDSLQSVMAEMTRSRNRHLPVTTDGRLVGLVSIGDVVKHRLDDMQLETNVLRDSYRARH